MRPAQITLTLALALAAATTASAQTASNPLARSEHGSFYYGALNGPRSAISSPLGAGNQNEISRPNARFGTPVTPVPEPSDWSMMLVGLAFVGWIMRRRSKGS